MSNDRLKADWDDICDTTYTGSWSSLGAKCKDLSRRAWGVLNSLGPSVDEYLKEFAEAEKEKDVGYVQD